MAVSLGRSSGATLIGRPLDITVEARLDGDEGQECVEAEVFYADERLDGRRVRTSLERTGGAGQDARIRVRVARPVDEPVVTVYLRAGCVQRSERRYVLLADIATEPAATTPRPTAPSAGPAGAPRVSAPAADTTTGRSGVPHSEAAPRVRRAAAPAVPAQPLARLKLEPINLSVESSPSLRSSSEILAVPATRPEQRAQAAALWTALSAQPEDVLAAAAKLAAVESAVRELQLETQKNQAAVRELAAALQNARDERYAKGLVYGLLAALVLALAGLAYFWRRASRGGPAAPHELPWWTQNAPPDTDWHSALGPVASDVVLPAEDSASSQPPSRPPKAVQASAAAPPRAATARRGVSSRLPPLSRRDQTDFALSMPHTPARAAKAEELLDIQDQAEFFVSIGQGNRAIDILLDHIDDDLQSSALIYLDLLDLYHRLDRASDYTELAGSFMHMFNAQIPSFEAYADRMGQGRGLDAYAASLANIRSVWPRAAVLTIMESMIFRSPEGQGEVFDPEAFRDLLTLYGVARELVAVQASSPAAWADFDLSGPSGGPGSRAATSVAPSVDEEMDALPVIEAPPETGQGVDIDLAALDEGDADRTGRFDPADPPVLVRPAASSAPTPLAPLLEFELLSLQPLNAGAGKGCADPHDQDGPR